MVIASLSAAHEANVSSAFLFEFLSSSLRCTWGKPRRQNLQQTSQAYAGAPREYGGLHSRCARRFWKGGTGFNRAQIKLTVFVRLHFPAVDAQSLSVCMTPATFVGGRYIFVRSKLSI